MSDTASSPFKNPVRLPHKDWISIAIVLLALVLRLAWLGIKPPHFDEGVNGFFVDQMTEEGFYHYDPTNFHGPFHFYVLFVAQTLLGRHVWALRLPLALASTACVALALMFRPHFGKRPCQFAALAMAISPGMVFYGRYAIHETWLLASLLLVFLGLLGLWRSGEKRALWALMLGVTGMILTKETYVIHIAAMLLAVPALLALEQASDSAPALIAGQRWVRADLEVAMTVGGLLILFFYTGALLDWSSLPGMFQTFSAWFATGMQGESGHEKPWLWQFWQSGFIGFFQHGFTDIFTTNYWLTLFARYEWPALLGLVAAPFVVLPRTRRTTRYLAIYGLGALTAYSLVAYKTPWCLIVLMWPFLFLFGITLDRAFSRFDKWIVGSFAIALAACSLGATCLLNFRNFTDEDEPYVYVQTLPDVDNAVGPLKALAALDAVNFHLIGYVLTENQHPLAWMLGDFTRMNMGDEDHIPKKLDDADFVVIDDTLTEQIEPLLTDTYFKETVKIRGTSDNECVVYFRETKFRPCFPDRVAEFRPALKFD